MASNMPVRFNYRSLMNDQAEYQGAEPADTEAEDGAWLAGR